MLHFALHLIPYTLVLSLGILTGAAIARRNPLTSAKTLDELEDWYAREKKRLGW